MNMDPGLITFVCVSGIFLNIVAFILLITFVTTIDSGKSAVSSIPKWARSLMLFTVLIPWVYGMLLLVALLCVLVAVIAYSVHEFLEM